MQQFKEMRSFVFFWNCGLTAKNYYDILNMKLDKPFYKVLSKILYIRKGKAREIGCRKATGLKLMLGWPSEPITMLQ